MSEFFHDMQLAKLSENFLPAFLQNKMLTNFANEGGKRNPIFTKRFAGKVMRDNKDPFWARLQSVPLKNIPRKGEKRAKEIL